MLSNWDHLIILATKSEEDRRYNGMIRLAHYLPALHRVHKKPKMFKAL